MKDRLAEHIENALKSLGIEADSIVLEHPAELVRREDAKVLSFI